MIWEINLKSNRMIPGNYIIKTSAKWHTPTRKSTNLSTTERSSLSPSTSSTTKSLTTPSSKAKTSTPFPSSEDSKTSEDKTTLTCSFSTTEQETSKEELT